MREVLQIQGYRIGKLRGVECILQNYNQNQVGITILLPGKANVKKKCIS